MAQPHDVYGFGDILRAPLRRQGVGWRDVFHGWWMTSRMEFLPDALVHVALPLLLVLRHESWSPTLGVLSFWGLVVWLMGHWVGSSLNCLADYPVDRLDTGRKSLLADAIDRAMPQTLLWVNVAEALFATVVSVWCAVVLGKPLLMLFWLLGLALALAYSFTPVRTKERNWLNPVTLMLIVYFTPLFFVYHLLSPVWNAFDIAVLLVYCLQMVPMFLVDEVPDHDEDKAMHVLNPCVRYGRTTCSNIANGIYVLACLFSLGLFVANTDQWTVARSSAIVAALVAYGLVSREFFQLAFLSRTIAKAPDATTYQANIQALKRFAKTPVWLVGTGVGVLCLALAETFF